MKIIILYFLLPDPFTLNKVCRANVKSKGLFTWSGGKNPNLDLRKEREIRFKIENPFLDSTKGTHP